MTIAKISEMLAEVKNLNIESVEKIREQDMAQGYLIVASICSKIEMIIDYIPSLNEVLPETLEVEEINSIVSQIIEAMQNGDTILIGDLLEYELLEIITKWIDIINKYAEE